MLTCAHMAWKSTSAPHFFCTSGKETVENLKISPGQLAPCKEKRIKRRQTVSSAGCKVLVPNVGFLLASMSSYCRFRPVECSYSQSVSVLVPQDKIRGSAIYPHLHGVGNILTPAPLEPEIMLCFCCQILTKDHSESLLLIVLRIMLRTVRKSGDDHPGDRPHGFCVIQCKR